MFSYRPTRLEDEVPVPGSHVFVIADSGVSAEKTGTERDRYNRASRLAAQAARAWRTATGREAPHLGAAVARDAFSLDQMREVLRQVDSAFDSDELIRRADHFYMEHCQILPAAVDALRDGDLDAFGTQVDRSQRAAEELLDNQVAETSFLAREAQSLGAAAASSFGAGFGGSVWALVPGEEASSFRAAWASRYEDAFPEAGLRASFFVERPGPAASEL
jgi:galactokinase